MRHIWHKIIAWYLRRCWGSFHVYPYGSQGRYVALMNERQYHNFKAVEDEPYLSQDTLDRLRKRELLP